MLRQAAAAVLRHAPVRSGLRKIAFNAIMSKFFVEGRSYEFARMRDGVKIEVDTGDYDGRILYLFGTNDLKVSETCNALLDTNDIFLDIGANYSTIGLAASYCVGSEGRVHLFEPQQRLISTVRSAIEAGGYHNVVLHPIGLMDVDGTFEIKGPSDHSGKATFVDHEKSKDFPTIEVCSVKAVSSYVAPLVDGRPFGVKIDIEGSEPLVVPWLLAQPNLKFIVMEIAHNHAALLDEVRRSRMTLYGLNKNPIAVRFTRIHDIKEMARHHDYVAIRQVHDTRNSIGLSALRRSMA